MNVIASLRASGWVAVPALFLLMSPLIGCSGQEQTPVGEVLEYDPAEDPSVQASEEYMQDPMAGMEQEGGARP